MGHLGAGQGYALGAAVAKPGNLVCLFTGDGAMGFHMQEIETAVRYGLRVLFVVIADRQWGMVKINQMAALAPHKDRYPAALAERGHVNGDFGPVGWADVARAMGAHGASAADVNELHAAVAHCAALEGPSLIQIDVDPQAHMMCPALKNFKDMHVEPAGE
jgi:acetolactate synthase-1/2/3 large subunit